MTPDGDGVQLSRPRSYDGRRPRKFLHPAILWLALLPFGWGAWSPIYAGLKMRRRWVIGAGIVSLSALIGGCIALSRARPDARGAAAGVGTALWLASWAIAAAAWVAVRGEYGSLRSVARVTAKGASQPAAGMDVPGAPPSPRSTPGVINQSDGDPARAVGVADRDDAGMLRARSINPAARPDARRRVAPPSARPRSREPPQIKPMPVVTPFVPPARAAPTQDTEAREAWAAGWFTRLGVEGESAAYLEAVTAWRVAWRPERVRLLLVAESHVAELPGDGAAVVRAQPWARRQLPASFVRLVYCLGYGEDSLCFPHPPKNAGTWQFWDVLGQVALGPGHLQPRKNASMLDARVRWKVTVLETLARRGIWLEDASPIAIYGSGGSRLVSGGTYQRVLQQGYNRHVWPGVRNDHPVSVWVIGRTTGQALAGLPGIDASHVISQPQDRDQGRVREGINRLCAAASRIAPE